MGGGGSRGRSDGGSRGGSDSGSKGVSKYIDVGRVDSLGIGVGGRVVGGREVEVGIDVEVCGGGIDVTTCRGVSGDVRGGRRIGERIGVGVGRVHNGVDIRHRSVLGIVLRNVPRRRRRSPV